jgi:Ca-activated chloride channel family protein
MSHRVWGPALLIFSLLLLVVFSTPKRVAYASPRTATSGSMQIMGVPGESFCPLKHTEVRGAISGFIARVTVTQVFENPASNPIEAVYTFPLPENAAVDEMNIHIGDRTVRGLIKKREEARAIYERAKNTGHVAALLDQERPNIFTQAIANIMPGEQISVTISYVQTLRYEEGLMNSYFRWSWGRATFPDRAPGSKVEAGRRIQTRFPMARGLRRM